MTIHNKERYSVRELSTQLNIPYKYLGQLMPRLVRAGLLEVQQGKDGGYSLTRNSSQIFLYEIVEAVEGLDILQRCILGFKICDDTHPCPVHRYWGPIRDQFRKMLQEISLEELKNSEYVRV